MYLLLRSNSHNLLLLDFVFCIVQLFSCFEFYLDLFSFSLCIVCLIAYVCYCLSMLDFLECEACYYESQQYKASSHFDHTFHTQFLCISFNPQTLHEQDLITCGYWEVVDEVEPIALLYSNPWELLLHIAYIAMLCSQTRFG